MQLNVCCGTSGCVCVWSTETKASMYFRQNETMRSRKQAETESTYLHVVSVQVSLILFTLTEEKTNLRCINWRNPLKSRRFRSARDNCVLFVWTRRLLRPLLFIKEAASRWAEIRTRLVKMPEPKAKNLTAVFPDFPSSHCDFLGKDGRKAEKDAQRMRMWAGPFALVAYGSLRGRDFLSPFFKLLKLC